MQKWHLTAGTALALALTGTSFAQIEGEKIQEKAPEVKKLTWGDKAPDLYIGSWLKGEQFSSFQDGKVYVVEFWATWCGPCVASIPHLTELQKKHRDDGLTIVGVSVDKNVDIVPDWVTEKGDEMGYTVAIQKYVDEKGQMSAHWMEPAGQRGIPASFVVDRKGKIAWIGHPMGLDYVLDKVIANEWDAAKEKLAHDRSQKMMSDAFGKARAGDMGAAIKILDDLIADNGPMTDNAIPQRFMMSLRHDAADAMAFFAKHRESFWDDASQLNAMSWTILTDSSIVDPDKRAALRMAERAAQLTDWKEPNILDTVAKAYFDNNDVKNAIKWQQKAIELIEAEEMPEQAKESALEDFRKRLNEYKDSIG